MSRKIIKEEKFSVSNLSELQVLANKLSAVFKPGDWIDLRGEMGAGKTTFVRFLLSAWGYTDPVQSPTFPLLIEYQLSDRRVLHIDAFRLKGDAPWNWSDWKDEILFMEWSEKAAAPNSRFDYEIEIESLSEESQRSIALRTLKR